MDDVLSPKQMRGNPYEPVRKRCEACGDEVVELLTGGRRIQVDHPELSADERDVEVGLVLAVDLVGHARPLRLPGVFEPGEAVHRPHELHCHPEDGR